MSVSVQKSFQLLSPDHCLTHYDGEMQHSIHDNHRDSDGKGSVNRVFVTSPDGLQSNSRQVRDSLQLCWIKSPLSEPEDVDKKWDFGTVENCKRDCPFEVQHLGSKWQFDGFERRLNSENPRSRYKNKSEGPGGVGKCINSPKNEDQHFDLLCGLENIDKWSNAFQNMNELSNQSSESESGRTLKQSSFEKKRINHTWDFDSGAKCPSIVHSTPEEELNGCYTGGCTDNVPTPQADPISETCPQEQLERLIRDIDASYQNMLREDVGRYTVSSD